MYLACGFPTNFELEDDFGGSLCLSTDEHLHTESDCPSDFKNVNRHKFDAEEGGTIPQNWCQLRFSYNSGFLKAKNFPSEKEIVLSWDGSSSYFKAVDSGFGDGKFAIMEHQTNKYLRVDGHHLKPKSATNCGSNCHFKITDTASAPTPPPAGMLI